MLFQTSQEHQQLRAQIREWAEKEIKPIAFSLDKNNEFPKKQIRDFGKMGFMGIPYPKEYGGAGKDILSYAIAVEELSRVDGGTGVILSAHVSLGAYPIYAYGTQEQKEKYLIPLAKGEKIGAFGLTEPNAGSDAGGTETTAELVGDHYILNGEKIFITNGGEADTYVIFAVTTPGIGTKGISAFIVEKGDKGFSAPKHENKMGIRGSIAAELVFEDCRIPKDRLLSQEGKGFKVAMSSLDVGRLGIAAQALGIAQGAFDETVKYMKQRKQFGKTLDKFQALSFEMASMKVKIDGARYLLYDACNRRDLGLPATVAAAEAKLACSEAASYVTNKAVQFHGGYGYIKDYPVERMYRDAKITEIYEGTSEVMKMVMSGEIFKEEEEKR